MKKTRRVQRRFEALQMEPRHRFVGDDDQRRRPRARREMCTGGVDQPVVDKDVVRAIAEIDSKGLAHIAGCAVRSSTRNSSIARATRAAVARGFSSVVSTTRSASA